MLIAIGSVIGIVVILGIVISLASRKPLSSGNPNGTNHYSGPCVGECTPSRKRVLTKHKAESGGRVVETVPHQTYQSQRFRWRAVEKQKEKVGKQVV